MKYFILTILICCSLFQQTISQGVVDIPIKKISWNVSEKNLVRFIVTYKSEKDTTLRVNNIVIRNAFIVKFHVQDSLPSIPGFNISLLFGTSDDKQLKIIADNNNDGVYSDEQIYSVSFRNNSDNLDLFNLAPVILVKRPLNKKGSQNIYFKILLTKTNGKYFENEEDYIKTKMINVDIYASSFYSGDFVVESVRYELAIIPHPFIFPAVSQNNSTYDARKTFFNIYKNGIEKDSLVSFNILANYSFEGKSKEYIKIGKEMYKLDFISLKDSLVRISKVESVINQQGSFDFEIFSKQGLINTRTEKEEKIKYSETKKYTLLHFTGSWCAPCQTSLPALFEFYQKYKDQVQIISIQKENNFLKAKQYLNEKKILWDCYFEYLNCSNPPCLSKEIGITAYPSFLLFDSKGNLIIKTESDTGINEIQKIINKIKY